MVGMSNNLPDIDARPWLLDNDLAIVSNKGFKRTPKLDDLVQALMNIPKPPQKCGDYVRSSKRYIACSGGMFELMNDGDIIYPKDELSFILRGGGTDIQVAGGVVVPPGAHCTTNAECVRVIHELVCGFKHLNPELSKTMGSELLIRFKLHS
jgi:hypothetical protein